LCTILLVTILTSCTCNCSDNVHTGGWNPPYGNTIIFARQGVSGIELCVLDSDGPDVATLTDDIGNEFYYAWSPDGTKVAYVSNDDEIYVVDADGSNKVKLTQDTKWNGMPAWSPDGDKIAFVGSEEIDGEDGIILQSNIYVTDSDGSNQTNLIDSNEYTHIKNPIWSPDSTKVAFMGGSEVGSMDYKHDLYVINADGSNMDNITNHDGYMYSPAWSPDGTKIAFYTYDSINRGICVVTVNDSDMETFTYQPDYFEGSPQWSPDGNKIAFASNRDGNWEIYVMDVDGTNLTNLSNSSESADRYPYWSYDGGMIAFASDRDGNWEIYVMNSDGSNMTNITNSPGDELYPVWSKRRAYP